MSALFLAAVATQRWAAIMHQPSECSRWIFFLVSRFQLFSRKQWSRAVIRFFGFMEEIFRSLRWEWFLHWWRWWPGGLDEHLHGDGKRLRDFHQTCHSFPSLWHGGFSSTKSDDPYQIIIIFIIAIIIIIIITLRFCLGSLVDLCLNLLLKFPTWRSRKGS